MKRSTIYESIASLLALGGVLMFGCGSIPCLNPIQWKMNFGGPDNLPVCIFTLITSIPIMWIAWRLSQEAQRIKKEEGTKDKMNKEE